jgi:hypothetical protein
MEKEEGGSGRRDVAVVAVGGGTGSNMSAEEAAADWASRQHVQGGNRGGACVGWSGGKRKENGPSSTE